MTTRDLIEMSLLDALGFLDEPERVAFDRAFSSAPPAVQAQVRREQTRLAHIELLLPEVAPPAGLRAAVIDAVRRAMAEATPIGDALVPPMVPARFVSRWWRAASLGLATAAVCFIGSTIYLWNANAELERLYRSDEMLAQLASQLGPGYVRDVLLDPDTTRVVFTRVGEASTAEASVFVNPEWKRSVFVCAGLAPADGRPYRLAIVDENDAIIRELALIEPTGTVTPRSIELDARGAVRLAVFAPSRDALPGVIVSRGSLGL